MVDPLCILPDAKVPRARLSCANFKHREVRIRHAEFGRTSDQIMITMFAMRVGETRGTSRICKLRKLRPPLELPTSKSPSFLFGFGSSLGLV